MRETAARLEGNYDLWDAEARVELASKKHKPAAEAYLRLVKAGGEAVKPLFWEEQKSEVEKPKKAEKTKGKPAQQA